MCLQRKGKGVTGVWGAGAGPHHNLQLSPQPWICYSCFLWVLSPTLSRRGPERFLRACCVHMGPASRQAVCAQWSRACTLEPDFLDSNRSSSFPVPGVGSFCLRVTQVLGWGVTDLDFGLCHLLTWESFRNPLRLSFLICEIMIVNTCCS